MVEIEAGRTDEFKRGACAAKVDIAAQKLSRNIQHILKQES